MTKMLFVEHILCYIFFLFVKPNLIWTDKTPNTDQLLVITVATEKTEGYQRYMRSVENFGHKIQVLGMGKHWTGGDVKKLPGGGQKVKLLQQFVKNLPDDDSRVILFTDSYDVIINGDSSEIMNRFKHTKSDILFSAEEFCWPDASLKVKYPVVKSGKRYLNSGLFIGYSYALKKLLAHGAAIADVDDDQLFYTKIFLDEKLRNDLNIKLDHVSEIFQNLNGATEDVDLNFDNKYSNSYVTLRNLAYNTEPLVVHGNGPSKIFLNYLGNYLGKAWISIVGCMECANLPKTFVEATDANLPKITLALFIEQPTAFLDDFFQSISNLKYPKKKISLLIHNSEEYHDTTVESFAKTNSSLYKSLIVSKSSLKSTQREARDKAIDAATNDASAFLFVIDADVRLEDELVIHKLMDLNKPIVAPMVVKRKKLFSNFWGSVADDGFYARSEDYVSIVERKREGVWNVPHISSVYLINADALSALKGAYSFNSLYDPDMSFSRFCVDQSFFMHVDNRANYGYLIASDEFDISRKHPDFYEMFDNQENWEKKYLHENYTKVLNNSSSIVQPCPDVYWFPTFNDLFCQHLIDIMENFGKWSSGNNQDERLSGGYENVPTRDIHMNQVGLERHWLYMLDQYFRPIQEKLFTGYYHVPPHAIMNFVVRYKPDEQPSLKPHHDASTYTINLALNRYGMDYEGGGSHFLRYNCSLIENRRGWAMMHPGRLTHLHEGLRTTAGTRYIMVSFVDP